MSRPIDGLVLLVAAAILATGPAEAQRLEVDPTRASTYVPTAIPTRPGELIASELSAVDAASGVERSAEWYVLTGRAGEVITAQVRSEIPTLRVSFRSIRTPLNALAEGPAKDAPLRLVLPKDDTYVMVVHSEGPRRFGKYLLSLGVGDAVPAFEPATAAPVRIAQPTSAPAALPPMPSIPGVTNVQVGQTLARPAGKPGTAVELYGFIGEAGSSLQVFAEGAAGHGLTLYTPEGVEMLSAAGLGLAKLDAILPTDGIYLLAVARQDAATPFELALAAQSPDPVMWSFRSYAGHETLAADGSVAYWTCWAAPGTVLQYQMADGSRHRLTLHPGGTGRWDFTSANGQPGGYNFTTRLEGMTVIRTSESGSVQTWKLDDPPRPHGAYRRYLCQ